MCFSALGPDFVGFGGLLTLEICVVIPGSAHAPPVGDGSGFLLYWDVPDRVGLSISFVVTSLSSSDDMTSAGDSCVLSPATFRPPNALVVLVVIRAVPVIVFLC